MVKNQKEIESMKEAGEKLARVMEELEKNAMPGRNTLELDKLAEKLVFRSGGQPAFKGYSNGGGKPYPATICASLNDEVVHGVPASGRILKDGDILKIDIGMKYKGMFADMARSFPIGNVDAAAGKLIKTAEQCFWQGVGKLKAGRRLSEYSKAVEKYAKKKGFSVVRNLVGHGIGKALHEPPQIPNYWEKNYKDIKLVSGMTFALEPMINEGTYETYIGSDGWVFKTRDGKLSAHYENTVLITDEGVEVLTV